MGIWGSVPHSGAHRAWFFSLISTCGRGGFVEKMCVTRRELYTVRLSKIFLDNLVSVQECSRWENVKCCSITRPGVNISARGFKLSQNAIYLPCMSIENISNKLQKNHLATQVGRITPSEGGQFVIGHCWKTNYLMLRPCVFVHTRSIYFILNSLFNSLPPPPPPHTHTYTHIHTKSDLLIREKESLTFSVKIPQRWRHSS